jgi:hypothetical protein
MRLRPGPRTALVLALALLAPACGDPCYIVPTSVAIAADRYFLEAPGDVALTAVTELGVDSCGPSPTEVVAYHWQLDGEPLDADDGEPLGAEITIHLDTPGTHVVEVRIEDDVGAEIPYVGRASILVY